MTATWPRRVLLALGLVLAVLATSPGTASAVFTARTSAAVTAGTATVATPAGLTAAGSTTCTTLTLRFTVRLAWSAVTPPTTKGTVTGYRVTESVNGTPRAPVVVATPSFTRSDGRLLAADTHTFTVAAVTSYGWSSAVPATLVYTC